MEDKEKFKSSVPFSQKPSLFKNSSLQKNLNKELRDNSNDFISNIPHENLKTFISNVLSSKKHNKNLLDFNLKKKTILLEHIHIQYNFNVFLQAILGIGTVLLGIVEYEHTVIEVPGKPGVYFHSHKYDQNIINEYNIDETYFNNLRSSALVSSYITFGISILLWITIIFNQFFEHQLVTSSVQATFSEVYIKKNIIKVIIHLILCLPASMPMTFGIDCHLYNDNYKIDYNIPLNSIFTSISLFRLIYAFKYYLVSSPAYSERAFRLCKINNVKPTLWFPFKVSIETSPLEVDIQLFVIFLFICSYNVRIYERYFDIYTDRIFGNFLNDLWYIFITMTTVGYGDLFASTIFGRIFTIIGCSIGVCLVSITVVSASSYLNIDKVEDNIYTTLENTESMERTKEISSKFISNFLKIRKVRREIFEHNTKDKFMKKFRKRIRKAFSEYKDSEKEISLKTDFDDILRYLRYLEDKVNNTEEQFCLINKLLNRIKKEVDEKLNLFL